MTRYRGARALPLPRSSARRVMELPVSGNAGSEKALSRGALHSILKEVLGMAAILAGASAHWLRHTTGSHMAHQVDCTMCATTSGTALCQRRTATFTARQRTG